MTCNKKWILCDNQRDDLSGWTRKAQAYQKPKWAKKKSWSHCLGVCCPSDPLQLSWTLVKQPPCEEVCSADQWDAPKAAIPAAGIKIQHQKAPVFPPWQHLAEMNNPVLQKLNRIGNTKFYPHPPYSPDLLPTNYHLFNHLDNIVGKMLPQPTGWKCITKNSLNPKTQIFMWE